MPSINGGSQFEAGYGDHLFKCATKIKSAAFGTYTCGDTIQGGIRLCSVCQENFEVRKSLLMDNPTKNSFTPVEPKELGLQSVADQKRDFENLDIRLYLALKALIKAMDARGIMRPVETELGTAQQDALMTMRDFEDSHGPVPEWAIGRNFGLELVEGAQLYTLDGRRHGNGWIVGVTEKYDLNIANRNNPYGEIIVYNVLTDAGSAIRDMSEAEVLSGWAVGEWICTRERILSRFDHDKTYEV